MVAVLFAVALAALQSQGQSQARGEAPAAVVKQAFAAIEGDSARTVGERWARRLRRDSTDRAARLGLATITRLSFDYAGAERQYVWLAGGRDGYALWAVLGQAQSYHMRGRVNDAGSWYDRASAAARELGDSVAAATALLGVSVVRARAQGAPAALAALDSGAALLPAGELALQAELRCRRAGLIPPQALALATEGGELARRSGSLRHQSACLTAMAQHYQRVGVADSISAILYRAAALQRAARYRDGVAATVQLHAYSAMSTGAYGSSWRLAQEAIREGEASGNLWPVPWARMTLAGIARDVRDLNAATEHLERAAPILEKLGDQAGLAYLDGFRGDVALARGDAATARRYYVAEQERARRHGLAQVLNQARFGCMQAAMRERDWDAAQRELDSAKAYYERVGATGWVAGLTNEYGIIAAGRGDLAAAERFLLEYEKGLHPNRHGPRAETGMRLAAIYLRRGDLARAAAAFIKASNELDAWRATLSDRELRLHAFETSRSGSPLPVAEVVAGLAAGGYAAEAFRLAERRRARDLADELVRARALGDDAAGGGGGARASGPSAAAGGVAADAIIAALPDSATAVLEFLTGPVGQPSVLFVLARERGLKAYILPPVDSLADDVSRLVALLEGGADARAAGRTLGEALLAPALADLPTGVRRLVIVPDDVLHRVPWDALVLGSGEYAAQRFALSLAPSAAVVAELWGRGAASAEGPVRLAALGDPAFGAAPRGVADVRQSLAELFRGAGEGRTTGGALAVPERLPASGREARMVARYARSADVRLRADASEAWLKRTPLTPYRVLHFATHAFVDEWSVARTALVLAPGGGEDGIVGPADLEALRLDADLVVLSACRTAGGVVLAGEGVRGLTAPLLRAGARSIVATAWKVGDQSTVAFVDAFYRAVASGLAVSDALRAAKLEAIRRGRPPREWAAFTLIGDPAVRPPLRPPPAGAVPR